MSEWCHAICPACDAACGVKVQIENGRLLKLIGDKNNPVYRGYSCEKGRRLPEDHDNPERLLRPQRRLDDGGFEALDYERAVAEIGDQVQALVDRHGPECVALYTGTFAYRPPVAPVARGFMHALGSPMQFNTATIDQPGKFLAAALHGQWLGGVHSFEEADSWLLIGTNPQVSKLGSLPAANPAYHLHQAKQRGLKLVVIDPRRTEVAKKADVFLQVNPGTDAVVLAGLIHIILAEALHDSGFVAEHCRGLETLRAAVAPFTPALVAERCAIAVDDLLRAARVFAGGRRGSACAGTGTNMAADGVLAEYLLACLNSLCGRARREGEPVANPGVLVPRGRYRAQAQSGMAQAWGFPPKLRTRGLSNTAVGLPTAALPEEILQPGPGKIRALICVGGNPAMTWPDQRRTLAALADLELLVVLDPRMSETAKRAHYVIPPTLGLECANSSFASEALQSIAPGWGYQRPYAQFTPPLIDPPAGSDLREDWQFFYLLAQHMGLSLRVRSGADMAWSIDPPKQTIALDMASPPSTEQLLQSLMSPSRYSLAEVGQYPEGAIFDDISDTVAEAEPGAGGHLVLDSEPMMSDLTRLATAPDDSPQALPLKMVSRRLAALINSVGSDRDKLRRRWTVTPLFMHPDDIEARALDVGARARLRSAHGEIPVQIEADDTMKPGVVSAPHSYGDRMSLSAAEPAGHTGALCDNALEYDPYSGIPRMSDIPVEVLG